MFSTNEKFEGNALTIDNEFFIRSCLKMISEILYKL